VGPSGYLLGGALRLSAGWGPQAICWASCSSSQATAARGSMCVPASDLLSLSAVSCWLSLQNTNITNTDWTDVVLRKDQQVSSSCPEMPNL
jgi:hypothetical protein